MSTIRHLINVVFLAALCVTVGHTCGHVSPSLRFQLVGFTSTPLPADTGVLGEEVMETTTVPANLGGEAWVRPVFGSGAGDGGFGNQMFIEASSGLTARPSGPAMLACRGWAMTGNDTGLVLDAAGGLTAGSCNETRPASCCAPLP